MNKTTLTTILMIVLLSLSAEALTNRDFLKLVDNTDFCSRNCHTTYEVCNPTEQPYLVKSQDDFRFTYNKVNGDLSSTNLKVYKNVTVSTPVWTYLDDERCVQENQSTICTPIRIINGSSIRNHQEEQWADFDPTWSLPASSCIKVRLEGKKDPYSSIDNVLNYAGRQFTEFVWWNTTNNYQNTFDDTTDMNLTNSTLINLTSGMIFIKDSPSSLNLGLHAANNTFPPTYSNPYCHKDNGDNNPLCDVMFDGNNATELLWYGVAGRLYTVMILPEQRPINALSIVFIDNNGANHDCNQMSFWIETNQSGIWTNVTHLRNNSGGGITQPFELNSGSASTLEWRYTFQMRGTNAIKLTQDGSSSASQLCTIKELIVRNAEFPSTGAFTSDVISLPFTATKYNLSINKTNYANHSINVNVSCDGINFVSNITQNAPIDCANPGDKLKYIIELKTTENRTTPYVGELNLTFYQSSGGGSATESEARTAIEDGIKDNFASAAILTDQEVYFKYVNGTQRTGIADKYFTYGNKRWVFNYLTGTDTTNAMSNLSTSVYIWEGQSLTTTQIRQQVRDLVNQTK